MADRNYHNDRPISNNPYHHSTPAPQQQYQGYAPPSGSPPSHNYGEQPFFDQSSPYGQQQPQQNPWSEQPSHLPPSMQQPLQPQNATYPPPGGNRQAASDFRESDFVPQDQRGEQREAMEQFEMNHGAESKADRDIAQLQREFPSVDGSLVAAVYGDSGETGGRERCLAS